jgi:hypothetical protein
MFSFYELNTVSCEKQGVMTKSDQIQITFPISDEADVL